MLFDIYNWFWIVGGAQDQVWSSAAMAYVPITDNNYQAWIAAGNIPSNINSEEELREILKRRASDICTQDERVDAAFERNGDADFVRLTFESFFELINRILVLEGNQQITRIQFKTWLKKKL